MTQVLGDKLAEYIQYRAIYKRGRTGRIQRGRKPSRGKEKKKFHGRPPSKSASALANRVTIDDSRYIRTKRGNFVPRNPREEEDSFKRKANRIRRNAKTEEESTERGSVLRNFPAVTLITTTKLLNLHQLGSTVLLGLKIFGASKLLSRKGGYSSGCISFCVCFFEGGFGRELVNKK